MTLTFDRASRRPDMFRRLAETVVIRVRSDLEAAIDAAMNLANFTVLVRRPVTA